ncbi:MULTISPECIES: 1,4-dihydroxy-2-naphthoate polyprenyltransferase [unclassified Halanaerobium]|uniref:1,4-dihydroxy-2-naphthoate polyprenyltransferase n=1 Tax=unclassified Halanaerobium TaxID=2641197 RepID=UPI000DF4C1D5|nr:MULTISPECIES: 1,4-dihydroxy-2-naphthoate polyprenyltransferase [unclassified Halanaerobium]RCW51429.1 1,4-dihydroxy-2-naphthoate octaprenyltransferase [Halanaerobium sp. MA284_MarDTE_T2]RCW89218.1 1,4-dihydroxy-2-naphthoate octaprenyltransferase [Halanaerobium sp. DL-01]
MTLTSFLKLVEIRTKIASITPFILGNIYAFYFYRSFNLHNFLLMFLSLLSIDMATTAINNYQDYKKAQQKKGYNYESHNAVVKYNLSVKNVKIVIGSLLTAASAFGVLLFLNTDIVVLLLGVISFLIGILYTCGPIPISRTPAGEIFSGFLMGFLIPMLTIYIHNMSLINIFTEGVFFTVQFNWIEILKIFLATFPLTAGIANIMLANNICDIEDDLENNRYTLPIYIGRDKSLKLFKIFYYLCYLFILITAVFKIVPFYSLLTFVTIPAVVKNINYFLQKQDKKETFILSIKNFIIINYSYIISFLIAFIIKYKF